MMDGFVVYESRLELHSIEKAAGFTIIDRSTTPLTQTGSGREFILDALQILQTARGTGRHAG
jgi:hypothetical protein